MQIVIDIPEARYKDIQRIAEVQLESNHFQTAEQIIAKGVPIEREPKTGHWIYGEDWTGRDGWYCNKCRRFEFWDYSLDMKSAELNLPNVCPKCGSKMVEPSEVEE